jgi:hypothetical protein
MSNHLKQFIFLVRIFMKRVLSLLLITSSILPMKNDVTPIKKGSFFAPSNLGTLELFHDTKGFFVNKANEEHRIEKHFTDSMVRNINKKQLNSFLNNGYLTLNQMNTGKYSLKAKGRIPGGGPVAGLIAYWTTKTLCYGVMVAGIGALFKSGGSVKVPLGKDGVDVPMPNPLKDVAMDQVGKIAGAYAQGSPVSLATLGDSMVGPIMPLSTEAAIATVASGPGIMGTAAFIDYTGNSENAKLVTGAGMLTAGGTKIGVAGAIEAVALKVGVFFGMTPTP